MSDSVRPHRRQLTRLPRPWDSPGKDTGVGCHFLLQCMKVKSESLAAQLCPTLSDSLDCSPPGSSVHGILQARVLEWGAIAFSVARASVTKYHRLGGLNNGSFGDWKSKFKVSAGLVSSEASLACILTWSFLCVRVSLVSLPLLIKTLVRLD